MRQLLFLIMILSVSGLWADLDDFEEDVERTEELNQWEEENEDDIPSENGSSSSDCSVWSGCFEFVFDVFGYVWVANNIGTTYEAFPYAEEGFMHWDEDLNPYPRSDRKDHWYEFSVQGAYMDTLGYGTWFTLEGHFFRFLGPYLEAFVFFDDDQQLYGQRIGLTFSIFQSDPLSMSVYGQLNNWRGALDRFGGSYGVEFKSYPAQPIFLKFRAGVQDFESFDVAEVEGEIGFMLDRYSLNAGWRYWNLGTNQGTLTNTYNGPYLGLGVYF